MIFSAMILCFCRFVFGGAVRLLSFLPRGCDIYKIKKPADRLLFWKRYLADIIYKPKQRVQHGYSFPQYEAAGPSDPKGIAHKYQLMNL
jgi:hypothetical protein